MGIFIQNSRGIFQSKFCGCRQQQQQHPAAAASPQLQLLRSISSSQQQLLPAGASRCQQQFMHVGSFMTACQLLLMRMRTVKNAGSI
jgi:hypothetical protein